MLPSRIPFPLANTLPGRVVRRLIPSMQIDYGPMNGQSGRKQLLEALLGAASIEAVFETGAYLGSSTVYLARKFSGPVYAVEANAEYLRTARRRVSKHSNVVLEEGDSRTALRRWAEEPLIPDSGVFFYLDAHWDDDLPLAEELEVIARMWSDAVVMIDDFEVPGDQDYGFDDYGPGKRLCLSYIPDRLHATWIPMFPSRRGSEEDGCRRGCVVLVPPHRADDLEGVLPVTRADWPDGS